MPPITLVDQAKARDVARFLRSHGLNALAVSFEKEWKDIATNAGSTARRSTTVASKSDRAASCGGSSSPRADVQPALLQVTERRRGVLVCVGSTEDVWEPYRDCVSGAILYPLYAHGAGIPRDDHLSVLEEEVPFVPARPYEKEAPPQGLPLRQQDLTVLYEEGTTAQGESLELSLDEGALIAGRYRVVRYLGEGTFSTVVRCVDERTQVGVCLKAIRSSKEYFDQALTEVRLLQLAREAGDSDTTSLVQIFDSFYYKERFFIVTELLEESMLKALSRGPSNPTLQSFFTLARIQRVTKQVLTALKTLHALRLIHCDVKPENILFKSVRANVVKLIDLGNACYVTDSLSSYVQSRSYRAPEVILGCEYGTAIDIWSLGATLPELATGTVLFDTVSIPSLLASIAALCGPIPAEMLHQGRNTFYYVTKYGTFYEYSGSQLQYYFPCSETLSVREWGFDDPHYVDFVKQCLTLNPDLRPSAEQLLLHPFLTTEYPE